LPGGSIWNPYAPHMDENGVYQTPDVNTRWSERSDPIPTINMTVNGTADRDFAARLAKAIADGGGLRTEWQAAVG
jgi:hypothetical protein